MAENLEEMVGQMKNQVLQQERFMGNFSHELKTPMTSIIGYADLIRGGGLDETEVREAAEYIVSEGKRLENLSMKLLELLSVKNERNCFVVYSPAVIICAIVDSLRQLYSERHVEIKCRTEEGLCRMDPDLFYSLMLNLIDNAFKAAQSQGGKIIITQNMTKNGCRIFVRDDGRGIPEDSISHLTEAFYRVDKSRSRCVGGSGLGLSLCGEIVHIHGGYLRFRSIEGKGTVVMAVLKGGRDEKIEENISDNGGLVSGAVTHRSGIFFA